MTVLSGSYKCFTEIKDRNLSKTNSSILCDFSLKISINIKAEKVIITFIKICGSLSVPVWWEDNRIRGFRILVNKEMKGWHGWGAM